MRCGAAPGYNGGVAVIDTESEFDMLAYVRMLKADGVEERQADAHAEAARAGIANGAALVTLPARIRTDFYSALWPLTPEFGT